MVKEYGNESKKCINSCKETKKTNNLDTNMYRYNETAFTLILKP